MTFGIPLVIHSIVMATIIEKLESKVNPDPELLFNYLQIFTLMMILFMAVFLGWFWSVAIGLQRLIPSNLKLNVNKFKVFLLIPAVYILLFLAYFMTAFTAGNPVLGMFFIIIPLHLFSMFCLFYCLYFVAKTIKIAELKRQVSFGDFAGEFFLIWFYPVGIWIVQPKINAMMKEIEDNTDDNLNINQHLKSF
ncbi:MAG: hypothetical protein R2852_04375 [Bacteroidia bacterium]